MQRLMRLNSWVVLISCLVLTAVSGWQMSNLPLWGYWPMGLMLGAWGGLVSLFWFKIVQTDSHRKHFLLSTLTGILLWLGFPDMPLFPAILVAFVPLLRIESELQEAYDSGTKRRMFFYVFHAMLLWNILSTFWVMNTAFMAGIFANVVNSLLMCIPWLAYHWSRHYTGDKYRWVSFVSFWLMFEVLHLHWELTWPFLSLGNALAQYPQIAQWYEYTGMLGGSVWILAVNVFLFRYWKGSHDAQSKKRVGIVAIVCIILPVVISLTIYTLYQKEGEEVEVVIIQPNFEPHYKKFSVSAEVQLKRYIELAKTSLTKKTRYLVFPETAFGGFDFNHFKSEPSYLEMMSLIDTFPDCAVITGLDPYRFLEPDEESPAKRAFISPGSDTLWWEATNMAVQIAKEGTVQSYLKGKLVPGAEVYPYRWFFFFMEPLVDQLGGSLEGLRRSEQRAVFSHKDKNVGPVICYESVFGEYCAGYIRKGANALAIITNDGWWDNTPGHRQHLKIGVLRAIETRRDIMRSANTGISCLIDQRGMVLQPTEYEETAVVKGMIRLRDGYTFYVRYGDIIGRIAMFLASVIFVLTFVRWLQSKWIDRLG